MSKRALEKFLFRLDKDDDLIAAFKADPKSVLSDLELDPAERDALAKGDLVALYRWGIHPLLIRNFSGALQLDYVAQYKEAGIS